MHPDETSVCPDRALQPRHAARRSSPGAIVIGAGVAGLTAAHELERRSVRTLVLESRRRLGGRALTRRRDGFTLDLGTQFMAGRYLETRRLCEELGIHDQLHRFRLNVGIASAAGGGREVVIQSWPRRWAFLRFLAWLLARRRDFSVSDPQRVLSLDRQSVAQFVLKKYDRELLEGWFQPFVTGATCAQPEELSAACALTYMALNLSGSYTLRQGMGTLVDALSARPSEVWFDCRATEVIVERGRVRAVRVARNGRPEVLEANSVVVATPAPAAARLLRGWSASAVYALSQVKYTCCIHAVFATRGRLLEGLYGVAVARALHSSVAVLTEDTEKCGAYAPAGAGVMHVVTDDRVARRLWARSDHEVEGLLAEGVGELGVPLGRPIFAIVHRWRHNMCIVAPGQLEAMRSLRRKSAEIEGLALAGDYLYVPCLEAAVASGRRAADRLTGSLPRLETTKRLGRQGERK